MKELISPAQPLRGRGTGGIFVHKTQRQKIPNSHRPRRFMNAGKGGYDFKIMILKTYMYEYCINIGGGASLRRVVLAKPPLGGRFIKPLEFHERGFSRPREGEGL